VSIWNRAKPWHLVCLLSLLLMGGCGTDTRERPNFVILIADDLGWNDVGAYGNDFVHTPNIDQLAREGIQFTRAFLTTASCSASRASILTGRYPHSNGLVHLHQSLAPEEQTIAGALKEAGYFSGSAGKWHIGHGPKSQFDQVLGEREETGTRYWIDILRDRPRDRPFFLWLGSRDPHRPHDGGTEFAKQYDVSAIRVPQRFVDGPEVRKELLDYYLEASRFDFDVGRVITELKEQGELDNTVVIVMSDNGRPFHGGKEMLYDDGIKTPFIVYWPQGMGQPGKYEHLISVIDVAPTLLELAGVPTSPGMQGRSFASIFADRTITLHDYIYAERNWHGRNFHERAVRSSKFLYKENQYPDTGDCVHSGYKSSGPYQALVKSYERGELDEIGEACFAKVRDAIQLLAVSDRGVDYRNLAKSPEHAGVLREMARELRAWRESTGDFDYQPYEPPPKGKK
jgi:N-sulfoglucosamine sulfohydrolase